MTTTILEAHVPSSQAAGTRTILIVDDEEQLAGFLGKLLKHQGYNVFYADNGKKAVDIYKENQKNIDLILMDIAMPIMNGIEAHKALTQLNSKALILLMSGYSQESFTGLEHAHFIRKPMHPTELFKSINDIFESSQATLTEC